MRTKLLVTIFFLSVLVFCAGVWLKTQRNVSVLAKNGQNNVSIEVIQLPPVDGVVPVEIQKEMINNTASLDELTFVVKNNTKKAIDAISVAVTVKAETNGKDCSSTAAYMTVNQLIHPDIRAIHHQKPFGPGEDAPFGPEPLQVATGTIFKGISLKIDYVDFEDKTSLGPNIRGLLHINSPRVGAAKYKDWLVTAYSNGGRSLNSLLTLLKQRELPQDLILPNNEKPGAKLYRRHLLMAYEEHGAAEVEKYLVR